MKKLLIIGGIAALLPTFALAAFVGTGENVVAPAPTTAQQNVYLVGGTVNVSNQVNGDALVAGGTVIVSGNIEKDLMIAGGNVSILGGSVEDLRVVGGNVTVNKKINGEAMIAGGQIIITSDTQIKGDSYIAGGSVHFFGIEEGNLVLAGGDIRVDGTVNGNLNIKGAERVTFGAQSVVKGMIEYSAPSEATIEAGAQLANTPIFKKMESAKNQNTSKGFLAFLGIMFFLKLIATLAAAYLLWYVCRKGMIMAIEDVHGSFWKVLLRGFGALILVPVASFILLFTVIGWIPAVVMLAAYVILLVIATPVAAIITASVLLKLLKKNHTDLTWYHILFGLVVLKLIALIPIIGWAACFVIYLTAIGAAVGVMKSKFSA